MSAGILSLGLYLEKFGLKRRKPRSRDEIEIGDGVKSGHGAPLFEKGGPQTRIRRAPVRAIASMRWPEGPDRVFGGLENVSPTGCLLKTEASVEPGTEVELEIAAIGTDPRIEVEVEGTVRHVTDVDGRRAYGIEFDSGDNQALRRLYNLAAGRD